MMGLDRRRHDSETNRSTVFIELFIVDKKQKLLFQFHISIRCNSNGLFHESLNGRTEIHTALFMKYVCVVSYLLNINSSRTLRWHSVTVL